MTGVDGSVCSAIVTGREIQFFVVNKRDEIQQHHAQGQFYEAEELEIIARFFPRGGVFVDIGANVGNHIIYVGNYLHPMQIIAIEPNPVAIPILKINVALNGLQRLVDLSQLGVGLSDVPRWAHALVPLDNLGGTVMNIVEGSEGLPLMPGDDILLRRRVDFIKMDVEGMEMPVLAGLAGTIAKWRPAMFVEVENRNADAFHAWIGAHDYVTACRYRRYPANENFMVLPVEASATIADRTDVEGA
jgi:FkbM family methyltransferase